MIKIHLKSVGCYICFLGWSETTTRKKGVKWSEGGVVIFYVPLEPRNRYL
jgi:hypothetical protein